MDDQRFQLDMVSVRLIKERELLSDKQITDHVSAIEVVGDFLSDLDREYFCMLNLNTAGNPINFNIVSVGTINASVVSIPNVIKSAVLSNAANIIVLHNHPSGNLKPSHADICMTNSLGKACNIMQIGFLDSVILGGNNKKFYSMREEGFISFEHVPEPSNTISHGTFTRRVR